MGTREWSSWSWEEDSFLRETPGTNTAEFTKPLAGGYHALLVSTAHTIPEGRMPFKRGIGPTVGPEACLYRVPKVRKSPPFADHDARRMAPPRFRE